MDTLTVIQRTATNLSFGGVRDGRVSELQAKPISGACGVSSKGAPELPEAALLLSTAKGPPAKSSARPCAQDLFFKEDLHHQNQRRRLVKRG